MNWKILKRRTWLNLIGAIILLVGLSSAALIYQKAEYYPEDVLGFKNSKRYRHDLEVYGGKFSVIMDDFSRWFAGLWQGKALAIMIGCTTIIISSGFFYAANYLQPGPNTPAHMKNDSDRKD